MKDMNSQVSHRAYQVFQDLAPTAAELQFEPVPAKGEIFRKAMIVLLGAYSTGKSSFINALLQSNDRAEGTAPQDDKVTVLAYDDTERSIPLVVDGRTLVTDDQLFFGGLNKFPKVTQHVELQFLHRPLLRDLYLVDTPGVFTEWGGRPYDYKSVMLWFARQAEVVLYFFDPLKPGVIHESVELYHAVHDVVSSSTATRTLFNMVNRATSVGDLAKSFGTLTFKLARPDRKSAPELPSSLVLTYFPRHNTTRDDGGPLAPHPERFPLEEFVLNGQKIIDLVTKAPQTVVFNKLDRLQSYVDHLQLHVSLLHAYFGQRVAGEAQLKRWWHGILFATFCAAVGGLLWYKPALMAGAAAVLVLAVLTQGLAPPLYAVQRSARVEEALHGLADTVSPALVEKEGCTLLTPRYSLERVMPHTLAAAIAFEARSAALNSYVPALEELGRLRAHVVGIRPTLGELRRLVQDSMGITPPDSFREKTVYF